MKLVLKMSLAILLYFTIASYPQNNKTNPTKKDSSTKKIGIHTIEEWHAVIDSAWGEGRSTNEKLLIFDLFWNTIDRKFGAFHNLEINWQAERDHYRPIIQNGVSKGRFAGIMTHLSFKLKELHTKVFDMDIFNTPLKRGVPLLVLFSEKELFNEGHFGAGLTPLSDSSLLVYKAIENHPLDLRPGDIIMGYHGILWKDLYKELITAELPVSSNLGPVPMATGLLGSSDESITHIWLKSAGLNWHLFDTIDIKKYDTNEILHLPVSPLDTLTQSLFCSEQIAPAGIPLPDIHSGEWTTWGAIENTNIGYINLWGWGDPSVEFQFPEAVNDLVLDKNVTGLIFDFRNATGGYPNFADPAFGLLFNETFDRLRYYMRSNDNNHLGLTYFPNPTYIFAFPVSNYLFDHPIAILTGPTAGSSGDINSLRLKYHPMARVFGKPTNTAFSGCSNIEFPFSEWLGVYANGGFCLDDSSNGFLTHVGFQVDEEVWLTPNTAANSKDLVVEKALEWINNLVYGHDINLSKISLKSNIDSLKISISIQNPNEHQTSSKIYIRNLDLTYIDSLELNKITSIGKTEKWSGSKQAPNFEDFFSLSVLAKDMNESKSWTTNNISRFTTAGPVVWSDYIIQQQNDSAYSMKVTLENNSSSFALSNISTILSTNDSNITDILSNYNPLFYPDIEPGQSVQNLGAYGYVFYTKNSPRIVDFTLNIYCNNHHYWTDTLMVDLVTDMEYELSNLPKEYKLKQNYPNPFNPTTTIKYQIPAQVRNDNSNVLLKVYDILGSEVATLLNEKQPPGNYEVEFDGSELTSGIYLYRLQVYTPGRAGDFVETRKMILIK